MLRMCMPGELILKIECLILLSCLMGGGYGVFGRRVGGWGGRVEWEDGGGMELGRARMDGRDGTGMRRGFGDERERGEGMDGMDGMNGLRRECAQDSIGVCERAFTIIQFNLIQTSHPPSRLASILIRTQDNQKNTDKGGTEVMMVEISARCCWDEYVAPGRGGLRSGEMRIGVGGLCT